MLAASAAIKAKYTLKRSMEITWKTFSAGATALISP